MNFNLKISICFIVLFSSSVLFNVSQAALIKETWDFQVKHVRGSYLSKNINDTFSLDFIYEDDGQFMHEYLADGSVVKNCNNISVADCDNIWDIYSLMADISMSDINFLFDSHALSLNGGIAFNKNVDKKSWRFQTDPNISVTNTERVAVVDDWFDVYLTDFLPSHMSDVAQFTFHYKNEFGGYQTSQLKAHINNRTSTTISVPEPSTLAIFLVGILVLVTRRLIKSNR